MPGSTSEGFPYPLDTDPIDVAGDIKKLADAINAKPYDFPAWAVGTFSLGTITATAAAAAMTLTGAADLSAFDANGIRVATAGLYRTSFSLIHSGATTGSQVINAEVAYFRSTDLVNALEVNGVFSGCPSTWFSFHHAHARELLPNDVIRIRVFGDGGGTIDNRSKFTVTRVAG